MAFYYAVLFFLCRSMICLSSSCFSSPTKFQTIWIFCRRWPLDLSGAWTIIIFTNSPAIVGVSSVIPIYLRMTAAKDKVHETIPRIAFVPRAAVTILLRRHVLARGKVQFASAVGAVEQAGEQPLLLGLLDGAVFVCPKFLYPFPYFFVDDSGLLQRCFPAFPFVRITARIFCWYRGHRNH